jgi:hypothetical protein
MAEARKKSMPDWANPSETDIAEAKEHGLDLTDPAIQVSKPTRPRHDTT